MNKIYFFLFFLAYSIISTAQDNKANPTEAELDVMAKLIQETSDVPGLAVGIIKNNQVYYSKGLGVQDLNSKLPLTTTSLFHMASVSKPFVATAILQLVETGKINLEDKLVDHLPYFAMKGRRFRKITIQQLLNHSSGIPDVEDYEWDKPQYDDGAAERYVRSFGETDLDFKPGKEYSYSNAAFDIMADVIAKASGMTFEDYMTKHIFEPLGMSNSTFYKPDVPKHLATQPHGMGADLQMEVLETYPYNRIHAPSSTLHSNVDDMTQWALTYLNKGQLNGNRIFSEHAYRLLTKQTIQVSDIRGICLGWFTREVGGERMFYHTGGDEGYRTFFGFFPESKSAIIMMGNSEHFQYSPSAMHLIEQVIVDDPKPWKKYMHFELKNIILTQGIDACKKHYYAAQKNQPDAYYFRGGYMDQLGYWLLDRDKNQEALEVFLFNVELLPEHAGFHDSVGDAYLAMDNKAKAIEWYEKALVLNPKQNFTIKKLKKLKKLK